MIGGGVGGGGGEEGVSDGCSEAGVRMWAMVVWWW